VRWWSLLLLILLLCIVACTRARKDQPEARSIAEPAPEKAVESTEGEVISKREITLTQTAPEQEPQLAAVQQSEQQKLLTLESLPILPEDFKIGPLADLVGVDRNILEMISVSTRFLNALQDGTIDRQSLHEAVREELTTSIRYYLDRDRIPVTYRIGAITMESSSEDEQEPSALQGRIAWMNVRLFGSPGVSEGELYLERSGGRWYVSDLQIDFEEMGQEYVREQEQYYPTIYGWGIQ
jgi:hypothetical protein